MHTLATLRLGCLSLIIVFAGCTYHKKSLYTAASDDKKTKEQIVVQAHAFSSQECKKTFGKNLLSYGYQPISLSIYNNSDDELLLRSSSFDIPLESPHSVAYAAHTPAFAITIVPAFFAGLFFWPALIPVGCLGFWLADRNHRMEHAVYKKNISGDTAFEILPYERVNKIIFISTNTHYRSFNFHLFNVHKKSFISFQIELKT